MRIALKVSSKNEGYNGGCEFALLDLTPEPAGLAVGRSALQTESAAEFSALRRNLAERAIDGVFSDRGFSIDWAV
jgi:hypothetical protein